MGCASTLTVHIDTGPEVDILSTKSSSLSSFDLLLSPDTRVMMVFANFYKNRDLAEADGVNIGGWSLANVVMPLKKDGKHGMQHLLQPRDDLTQRYS